MSITGQSTMSDVLAAYPSARRALFRKYHIGGCSSCGFQPKETLAEVCVRNNNLSVDEVLAHITASHEQDSQLEITPKDLASRRQSAESLRLLDIRTREEWDAVKIDGAEFVNQDLVQAIMGQTPREQLIVFYDHDGKSSLDAAAYFAGHGFTNAKYLRGGIDAWAAEVDPSVPRYKLERT
jgi:rhodanese-related sulfurtransferase